MERILTGLVKTGAWGCFDEFNRLDETTLSAISMNIHAIQEALRNSSQAVTIGEQEVGPVFLIVFRANKLCRCQLIDIVEYS